MMGCFFFFTEANVVMKRMDNKPILI